MGSLERLHCELHGVFDRSIGLGARVSLLYCLGADEGTRQEKNPRERARGKGIFDYRKETELIIWEMWLESCNLVALSLGLVRSQDSVGRVRF